MVGCNCECWPTCNFSSGYTFKPTNLDSLEDKHSCDSTPHSHKLKILCGSCTLVSNKESNAKKAKKVNKVNKVNEVNKVKVRKSGEKVEKCPRKSLLWSQDGPRKSVYVQSPTKRCCFKDLWAGDSQDKSHCKFSIWVIQCDHFRKQFNLHLIHFISWSFSLSLFILFILFFILDIFYTLSISIFLCLNLQASPKIHWGSS